MKKVMIREAVIYTVLLIVLSLLMHPDLFSDAGDRLTHLHERGNYYHPFLYAFIVYILLLFVRITIEKVIFLIKKFGFK
jgi:hypothetical protein